MSPTRRAPFSALAHSYVGHDSRSWPLRSSGRSRHAPTRAELDFLLPMAVRGKAPTNWRRECGEGGETRRRWAGDQNRRHPAKAPLMDPTSLMSHARVHGLDRARQASTGNNKRIDRTVILRHINGSAIRIEAGKGFRSFCLASSVIVHGARTASDRTS